MMGFAVRQVFKNLEEEKGGISRPSTLVRQSFACPQPTSLHGGEETLQGIPHCTLRHGLRHLHGVPPGEEPVPGMPFAGQKAP